MFIADLNFLIAGLGEEIDHRFLDQCFSLAEEIIDLVGKSIDHSSTRNSGFFFEFAGGGDQVGFPLFDMSLGKIPESSAIEEEIFSLAIMSAKNNHASGSLGLRHWGKV